MTSTEEPLPEDVVWSCINVVHLLTRIRESFGIIAVGKTCHVQFIGIDFYVLRRLSKRRELILFDMFYYIGLG